MPDPDPQPDPPELADPTWFREPTPREHWIAAALFVGFGLFFLALFFVQRHWWFRWIILALAILSILHGARHALDARRPAPPPPPAPPPASTPTDSNPWV